MRAEVRRGDLFHKGALRISHKDCLKRKAEAKAYRDYRRQVILASGKGGSNRAPYRDPPIAWPC